MTTDIEQIRDRIRKLLALGTDDAAMEGEAANAIRFARRLMVQHQVSEAEVAGPRDVHETAADTEYAQVGVPTSGSRLTGWESSLGQIVCKVVGTVQWYLSNDRDLNRRANGTVVLNPHTGQAASVRVVKFYGPARDAADATDMFRSWSETILAMARLRFAGALRGPGRSYCEGFVAGLWAKVKADLHEETAALAESMVDPQWALAMRSAGALVQAKRERGTAWLEDEIGCKLVSGSERGGGEHYGDAYSTGRTDGSKADMSARRLGKSHQLGNGGA